MNAPFFIAVFRNHLRMAAVLAAIAAFVPAVADASVSLMHVHGLAFSADGKRLLVPSHHGLAVHEGGRWSKAPGPQHDYMGFSATAKHFYSSGHPAPASGLMNPFGLVRSADGGRTWKSLGLEGETDFHLLATSWNTNAVYVWNPDPSSRIRKTGLHFTLNDGFSWKAASARGLQGEPHALAVHPDDAARVAVATANGIFVSNDSGESFRRLAVGQGTAVCFDLDGKRLWHGSFDRGPRLVSVALPGGESKAVSLPRMERDAVAYVAQNPAERSTYAIATFGRDVFLTRDGGASWIAIAEKGEGR